MKRIIMLVPCYNEEHRLDAYIHSIKKQSIHVDLIAVDDGSSDNTFEKLKGHNILHVERNPENLGLVKTINKLFQIAESYRPDFLTWSGADDDLYVDSIEKRLNFLTASQCDVVVSGVDFKTRDGFVKFPDTIPRLARLSRAEFKNLHEELLPSNFIAPPILLDMKRISYSDLPWDEKTKHLGDWDQWLTLSKKYTFSFLAGSTGLSDWDGTNYSASNPSLYWEKALEFLYVWNKHLIQKSDAVDPWLILKTVVRGFYRVSNDMACSLFPACSPLKVTPLGNQ